MYTVCPSEKCSALYSDGVNQRCCNQVSINGRVCGTPLGYEVNLAHGKKKWKAYKQYQFCPPSAWLKTFFASKAFMGLLGVKPRKPEFLEDIYDGRIWKEFCTCNFFNTKYNLGLMLSVDWFKPFKRSEYKVGAILLSVLNLPRGERFKKKWTIVAGMYYACV
jgi:hypothetical protein